MAALITYSEWFYLAKIYTKELIHVSILAIIVLCVAFAVAQSFLLCDGKTETISVQTTDTDIFSLAKAEYEANTGKKIYPAGERCLRNASAGCTTKEQVYEIIVRNMK